MFMWLPGQWDKCYEFDFDRALDGLCGTISYFNLSSFTSKNIVPPKAQHMFWQVPFLVKVFRIQK